MSVRQFLRHGPRWSGPLAVALGTLGSVATVLAGSRIGAVPRPPRYHWWFRVPTGPYWFAHLWLYAGLALMLLGWWSLQHAVAHHWLTTGRLALTGLLWGGPIFLGEPLFSRDVYSYVAQGLLVHAGQNPYHVAPSALGAGPVLDSVAWVWQQTPTPYGPLLTVVARLTSLVGTHSLLAQIFVYRTVALGALITLACLLVPLARHRGWNTQRAQWLVVLSPLTLWAILSSAHNDALMLALLAAGLVLADRGHRRWAYVAFALGATIKIPALAATAFVAWHDMVRVPRRRRAQLALEALGITGVSLVAITLLAGYGWTWLSPSALSIPTELRIEITPVVALSVFLASVLHACGWAIATHVVVSVGQHLAEAAAVLFVFYLLTKLHEHDFAYLLGIALMAAVLASPTVWPWYALWGLVPLAITRAQRSGFVVLLGGAAMLLVGPGGSPMLAGNSFYLTAPLLALAIWREMTPAVRHRLLAEATRD